MSYGHFSLCLHLGKVPSHRFTSVATSPTCLTKQSLNSSDERRWWLKVVRSTEREHSLAQQLLTVLRQWFELSKLNKPSEICHPLVLIRIAQGLPTLVAKNTQWRLWNSARHATQCKWKPNTRQTHTKHRPWLLTCHLSPLEMCRLQIRFPNAVLKKISWSQL